MRILVISAAALGVAADLLLRGDSDPRLGLALLVVMAAATAYALGARAERERGLLLAGLALAGLGLVVRDSGWLYPLHFGSVLYMGALAVWHGSGRRLAAFEVLDAPRTVVLAVLTALVGAPDVLRGVGGGDASRATAARTARALVIGVVLAVPPVMLATALLGSADTVFAGMLDRAGELLAADGVHHLVVIAVLSWLAAGWLRGALGSTPVVRLPEPRSPGLAFASVGVAPWALAALLALFLGTQLRVLFGGATYLQATAGLTVAEYARAGFFQLVVVAGVVLATLVAADWLMVRTDGAARRYRQVGTLLVALVAALLASAVVRLWLYVGHFGLTMDRLLAAAGLAWVLAAVAAFALTMLRGQAAPGTGGTTPSAAAPSTTASPGTVPVRPDARTRFAPAILAITVGWVASLTVVNPEAIVVRTNVARAVAGYPFDAAYHGRLSADAFPALRDAAPRLPAEVCAALNAEWGAARAKQRAARSDWRAWSLPFALARGSSAERFPCAARQATGGHPPPVTSARAW